MRAWWDAFGAGELQVGVIEREQVLAAALPMTSRRGRLSALANYHSPIFEPATVDGDGAAAEELLRAALARPEAEVFLPRCPRRRCPSFVAPRATAACSSRRRTPRRSCRPPARSRTMRRTLDRRSSAAAASWREHEVSLLLDDGDEDLDAALARGFEIEAGGWKTQAGTAILSAPETRCVLHGDRPRLPRTRRARPRHAVASTGARRPCISRCAAARGCTCSRPATSEHDAKLAPGLIAHLLTIEHCFADPSIEAYELLGAAGALEARVRKLRAPPRARIRLHPRALRHGSVVATAPRPAVGPAGASPGACSASTERITV